MLQFGVIDNPLRKISETSGYGGIQEGGIANFLNNGLRLLVIVAGLYALINIILAGYGFMSASDDPKAMMNAWNKIWQSALGLLVIAAAFVIIAILGQLLFGNPRAIFQPAVYGPGEP